MNYLKFILIIFFISNILHAQDIMIDEVPRDTSYTLHSAYIKARKQYPEIKKVLPCLPSDVQAIENIIYTYPAPGRELKLNIYRPNDNIKYPALLMVHGGGWSSGDLSLQIPMAQQIAKKGYVAIAVEYRLSPEAQYPAAVYDLKTAIGWIRAKGEKYGIDTARIAISGCSAGGLLAMLVGTTNYNTDYEPQGTGLGYSTNVHAIVNIDGISDFSTDELLAARESLAKNKIPASVRWLGGTYEDKKEVWEAASPINHVTKHSAPVLFVNSSVPRFHAGRNEIVSKLSVYNIYTEVYTVDNSPHTFWLFHPWFMIAVDETVSFLDKVLKAEKDD